LYFIKILVCEGLEVKTWFFASDDLSTTPHPGDRKNKKKRLFCSSQDLSSAVNVRGRKKVLPSSSKYISEEHIQFRLCK
jgi:hypothetical protein